MGVLPPHPGKAQSATPPKVHMHGFGEAGIVGEILASLLDKLMVPM